MQANARIGLYLNDAEPLVCEDAVPIASRCYSDLILSSNPSIPVSYFRSKTEFVHSTTQMGEILPDPKGWLWLRIGSGKLNDISNFAAEVLPRINHPVRLITTDGDNSIPGDLSESVVDAILSHRLVEVWYTQNYDWSVRHSKLKPIPIGFDLHTGSTPNEKWTVLKEASRQARPFSQRSSRVLFDGTARSHATRNALAKAVASLAHVETMDERLSFRSAMCRYSGHRFVLSPRGNGLDCHRTWELLALGCVPIVQAGPLDRMYQDRNLPIVIIDSWDELLDPSIVERWSQRFETGLGKNPAYLRRDFWLK